MKKILKEFFYNSKGIFNPVYFWMTVFLSIVAIIMVLEIVYASTMIWKGIAGSGMSLFPPHLVIGLLGFVATWVGFYNWHKIKTNGGSPETSTIVRQDVHLPGGTSARRVIEEAMSGNTPASSQP